MPITFYHCFASPPCANALLAAKCLGVELTIKVMDYAGGEHLKPEFLKMNPEHLLPTINDDGFILWESRPIMTYFADKYGKDDSLYPKDPQKRAVVNQRLYFDMGTVFQRFADYVYPQLFQSPRKPANPELLKKLHDGIEFLDGYLSAQSYVAGDNLTLADLSLIVTIATIQASRIDLDKYENVKKWFAKCKEIVPEWNIVDQHVEEFKTFFPADY